MLNARNAAKAYLEQNEDNSAVAAVITLPAEALSIENSDLISGSSGIAVTPITHISMRGEHYPSCRTVGEAIMSGEAETRREVMPPPVSGERLNVNGANINHCVIYETINQKSLSVQPA